MSVFKRAKVPEYVLIRAARKTISIKVTQDAIVEVRAPKYTPVREIEAFLAEKSDWIEEAKQEVFQRKERLRDIRKLDDESVEQLRKRARKVITPLVEYYADLMDVSYERIAIRTQKSRWGSCSGKHNLNYNALLVMAPESVIRYVVVHELCHLKQMNHSALFWSEVERVHPSYKADRKWLKDHGDELLAVLP